MNDSRLRWLLWVWRVASATYVAGAVTLLPGSSLIVFWTSLLFTPLLAWTLMVTRSRLIAALGVPLIGAAVVSAVRLWRSASGDVPQSTLFFTIWFLGIVAPLILYPVVSRYLRHKLQALV